MISCNGTTELARLICLAILSSHRNGFQRPNIPHTCKAGTCTRHGVKAWHNYLTTMCAKPGEKIRAVNDLVVCDRCRAMATNRQERKKVLLHSAVVLFFGLGIFFFDSYTTHACTFADRAHLDRYGRAYSLAASRLLGSHLLFAPAVPSNIQTLAALRSQSSKASG